MGRVILNLHFYTRSAQAERTKCLIQVDTDSWWWSQDPSIGVQSGTWALTHHQLTWWGSHSWRRVAEPGDKGLSKNKAPKVHHCAHGLLCSELSFSVQRTGLNLCIIWTQRSKGKVIIIWYLLPFLTIIVCLPTGICAPAPIQGQPGPLFSSTQGLYSWSAPLSHSLSVYPSFLNYFHHFTNRLYSLPASESLTWSQVLHLLPGPHHYCTTFLLPLKVNLAYKVVYTTYLHFLTTASYQTYIFLTANISMINIVLLLLSKYIKMYR